MGSEAARMHDALRDPFMIEVKDFFSKMKVFQKGRTTRADSQRILIVRNRHSLLRRQRRHARAGDLMEFTGSACDFA
jgi:hypothetical protein